MVIQIQAEPLQHITTQPHGKCISSFHTRPEVLGKYWDISAENAYIVRSIIGSIPETTQRIYKHQINSHNLYKELNNRSVGK